MRIGSLRLFVTVGLSAVLMSSASLPAMAEPLGQAVVDALNNHPAVQAALANSAAMTQAERQQYSNYFPHVSVRGTGGRIYADNATSRGLTVTRGAGYSGYGEGSVSLTQMIYDNAETSDRVVAARDRIESADFSVADIREELALRATLAYLDILRGQESLGQIRGHEALLHKYIKQIKGMVKSGAADGSMGVQAQDILEQLRHTRSDIEGQLAEARADYIEAVGVEPADPMPKPVPRLDMIPDDVDTALIYAKTHHPALKAAALKQEGLQSDSDAEKAHIYPNLTGELSYDKLDQRDVIGGEALAEKALVHLNWDYDVAGAQLAKMREARERANEAKAQRDQQERQIVDQIRKAYSKLGTAKDQLKITQDRQVLNEKLLKNNKDQFEGAKMNILQVLQAENALFNARLSLLNDRYRTTASQYAVLASIGRLQDSLDIHPVPDHDAAR